MASGNGVRELVNGPAGRAVTVALLVAAVATASWVIYSSLRPTATEAEVMNPLWLDVETNRPFHQRVTPELTVPCPSPFTGHRTGYPTELCYWTRDGQAKADPTPVALNDVTGKPGPTFCPDCGRLVVHHNPAPGAGVRPPPTHEQYAGGQ